jgi:hypothetical protein
MDKLELLEEGKSYTISFDDEYNRFPTIVEIRVLMKLKKSIKLLLLMKNEVIWYPTSRCILIFDEIPIKYYRKEKLEKINEE